MKKLKFLFSGVIIFGLVLAGSAQAAKFMGATKEDPNITVPAAETYNNLYLAGANVTVNSETKGDLFVAGGMVSLIGDVEEDLNIVGGSLTLSGKVGGDARVGGGNISVSSPIGGDLLLGGGNVALTANSSIGGDLVAGAGNLVVDSPVKGNVKIGGGSVTLNSKIEGDVNVVLDGGKHNEGTLIIGPDAEILGKIVYKGPKEAIIKEGAKINEIQYTPTSAVSKSFGKKLGFLLTIGFLIKLLAWIIAGLVFVKLMRKRILSVSQTVMQKPWSSLGLGLAGLVLTPVAVILLLVTVVGYYLAILLGIWYGLVLAVVALISSLVLGYWILKLLNKKSEKIKDWQAVVIGVVVFNLLKFIPILGWIVLLLLFLMTFGAMMLSIRERILQDN